MILLAEQRSNLLYLQYAKAQAVGYTESDALLEEYRQRDDRMKNGWISTRMTKVYFIKLVFRIAIFLGVLMMYLLKKEFMMSFMTTPVWKGVAPIHLLWFVFMVTMISHIFPLERVTMALKKAKPEPYQEVEGYSELELHRFIQDQNVKAWSVMLIWLIFNAIFGALYLFEVIGETDLLMLVVFYYLCDYICILFYCPFQHFLMKNKCCVNCRIYDWGHFMMFTPTLFIQNFFTWSLFFTSCVVLIHWEVIYAKHPERFWSGSNKTLQCANCKDKTCQMKNHLMRK